MVAKKAPSEERIAGAIIDGVRALQKSLSNAKLYSLEHPKATKPLELFVKRMNAVCNYIESVTLTASFEGLSWKRPTHPDV